MAVIAWMLLTMVTADHAPEIKHWPYEPWGGTDSNGGQPGRDSAGMLSALELAGRQGGVRVVSELRAITDSPRSAG